MERNICDSLCSSVDVQLCPVEKRHFVCGVEINAAEKQTDGLLQNDQAVKGGMLL